MKKVGYYILTMLLFSTSLYASGKALQGTKNRLKILSVISEPENNAIRNIYFDIDNKGKISSILVFKDRKLDARLSQKDLKKNKEVLVATVLGFKSFFVKVVEEQNYQYRIEMRYLSKAPNQFKSFALVGRKISPEHYALFNPETDEEVKWIHLSKRGSFLGIPIGIKSYSLSYNEPK